MGIGAKIVFGIVLVGCGFVVYYLFHEIKKEYVKQEKIELIKEGVDKMQELQALHSHDNELRIQKISKQIAQAEMVIESLEHHDIFC